MAIVYTPSQREIIVKESVGKVIESMTWEDDGDYWVMQFTDGSETSFRFMAELC